GGLPAPAPFYHIDGGHFNDVGRDQHNMFRNAYNSYQFNNYSGFGGHNLAKRTRGSGKWFLKNRRFRRWLKSKHGILWGLGLGKTVLAGVSIIVEYLQKEYLKELAGQVSATKYSFVCTGSRTSQPHPPRQSEHLDLGLYNQHRLEGTRPTPSPPDFISPRDLCLLTGLRSLRTGMISIALLHPFGKEPTLKQKTIASVKQKANGNVGIIIYRMMFLHASLQLSRLQQCRTRIMQAPETRRFAGTTILLWIVFADKAGSCQDLQTVLAMDARGDFQPEHVVPKDSLTQDVRLKKLLLEIEPRPYSRLASACITRLASCAKLSKKHPFLRHAYTSWHFYARRCASSDTAIQKTLEDFLLSCTSFPKTIKSGGLSTVDCFDNFPPQLSALRKANGHPLMAAAFQGCGTIVEQLLRLAKDAGKDVSALRECCQQRWPGCALLALENAHYNVAKIILETPGFQIHAASLGAYRSANDGVTALMYAARHGRLFILEALLRSSGASLSTPVDKDGKDALRHAVEARKVEIVEALLREDKLDGGSKSKAMLILSMSC
ncbi:hypothetical protein BKA70DRAFT_1286541, partial [Coprinopsis sp. MPI-PUGE-AT-0042]